MGDMVAPKAGIHQAFAVADVTISQSVRSIVSLIQRPGLIRIGFDDLLSALRSPNGRCLFGFGESDSDNRAHDALTQALKNPLMDRGRMLADASHVLVQVAGGPAMTLSEVEILMQELGRHINDRTQILFGTSVDGRMGNRLSVTLISSLSTEEEAPTKPVSYAKHEPAQEPKREAVAPPVPPIWEEPEPVTAEPPPVVVEPAFEPEFIQTPEPDVISEPEPVSYIQEEPVIEEAPAQPRVILPKKKPASIKEARPVEEKKLHAKQEVLQFEPVTRGRFEKSEPTIVEGQDLDIPTFLRKNVRVK
jgi:cell division protein FtsZ